MPHTVYFLNNFLKVRISDHAEFFSSFPIREPKPESFHSTVWACLKNNYAEVLEAFVRTTFNLSTCTGYIPFIVTVPFKSFYGKRLKTYLQEENCLKALYLILTAAKYSSVKTLGILFNLFSTLLHLDLSEACRKFKCNSESPLRVAVEWGNFEVVKFFADKYQLDNQSLIYHCLKNTYYSRKRLVMKN